MAAGSSASILSMALVVAIRGEDDARVRRIGQRVAGTAQLIDSALRSGAGGFADAGLEALMRLALAAPQQALHERILTVAAPGLSHRLGHDARNDDRLTLGWSPEGMFLQAETGGRGQFPYACRGDPLVRTANCTLTPVSALTRIE